MAAQWPVTNAHAVEPLRTSGPAVKKNTDPKHWFGSVLSKNISKFYLVFFFFFFLVLFLFVVLSAALITPL
jgi:hypothetical protein